MLNRTRIDLIKQMYCFLMISGIGWLLDFGTFLLLTNIFEINVGYANMLSSIPALTYVFMNSTRKVFQVRISKCSLKLKYVFYFIYQMILVSAMSAVAQMLFNSFTSIQLLQDMKFISEHLELFAKLIITPVTMICNFIFMKILAEIL